MITPDHPAAIAQLGQVETGGKDPDDNIAGKSPARTPSRVRRQPSPNHGPRNPPQTPVEMSQGKAAILPVCRTTMGLGQTGGADLWVVWEKPDQ